jgi:NADPH:quinone reductase-like Zn-dependent oxidoreductase
MALVAWQAVIETADVQAGQHVLVHGAAGGVSVYAVQLARWKGARVTGTSSARVTVSSFERWARRKAIDYNTTPFERSFAM